jgi:hypothetical protein
MCRLSWNLWASASWNPQGLSRSVTGLLYILQLSKLPHFCAVSFVMVVYLMSVCPHLANRESQNGFSWNSTLDPRWTSSTHSTCLNQIAMTDTISLLIYSQHNTTRFTIGLQPHVSTHMSHLQLILELVNFYQAYFLGSQNAYYLQFFFWLMWVETCRYNPIVNLVMLCWM